MLSYGYLQGKYFVTVIIRSRVLRYVIRKCYTIVMIRSPD